ncbi:hypothetical protein PHYNN_152 [Pantoea phage Phynn]|nr:hypothetical protein PHYNN_152 [Pantoea phage Phynn]
MTKKFFDLMRKHQQYFVSMVSDNRDSSILITLESPHTEWHHDFISELGIVTRVSASSYEVVFSRSI